MNKGLEISQTFSRRKSTMAFSPNAAAHMRGVKPRSSWRFNNELSARSTNILIFTQDTAYKSSCWFHNTTQVRQVLLFALLVSGYGHFSPLLRCVDTCKTSPWAASWWMDRTDETSKSQCFVHFIVHILNDMHNIPPSVIYKYTGIYIYSVHKTTEIF